MKLKVRNVQLTTGGPLVAVLHEKTAKALGIFPTDRLHVRRMHKKEGANCVINITKKGVQEDEIGLFEEVIKKLKVSHGVHVEVEQAEHPVSIQFIKKKLEGKELTEQELDLIVKDIVANELSETELTYFVSGCYSHGLSIKETVALTNAIVKNGEQLHFNKGEIVLDKHCSGGVPGNRTTMIVIPIIASLGYKIPKTSSRAITSPSGTADTFEVLAPVTLNKKKIEAVVKKTNACIVWGGGVDLASADDKMIKIRHPLSIDPTGMLLASIMAKKKAAGATHVLIDIPWGKNVKIETKKQAKVLRKGFLKVGKLLGLKIKVLLTDGSQPIGNGIGPALEATDVISVLKGDGPNDLRQKAIFMATEALKLIGEKDAEEKVIQALESGKAYQKFKEIIYAQGGLKHPNIPKAQFFYSINAKQEGKIKEINNKKIALIATLAGAPEEKSAGVYLRVRVSRWVKKGENLFTIYANTKQNLDTIKRQLKELDPIVYE
ncbi:thymidine phosphorylase [Candidatus Woesearchaeota archaeon]|nr:thymidine phosphorylase [Candidatus Woesearchaeota archaeon]